MKNIHAKTSYSIQIKETHISLSYLEQSGTYSGLYCGYPTVGINKSIVESVYKEYCSKYKTSGKRPYLLSPIETPIEIESKSKFDEVYEKMRKENPNDKRAQIPAVICYGIFKSYDPGSGDDEMLPIIWFQDDWGLDTSFEVINQFKTIDWKKEAYRVPNPLS